uniref:CCHC-type domain-containing protein n=1 Tax=Strongyloides venezuelensis TaxID=75913 RepID=A0A0K0FJS1_STRVS
MLNKDSVHRVYSRSIDKFKKNTFKRKTFNKKIQCHRCNKYGHIARNCNEIIRKIEDNTSDVENESDDDEIISIVSRIEGEKQLILPVKAYIGKKNCFGLKQKQIQDLQEPGHTYSLKNFRDNLPPRIFSIFWESALW